MPWTVWPALFQATVGVGASSVLAPSARSNFAAHRLQLETQPSQEADALRQRLHAVAAERQLSISDLRADEVRQWQHGSTLVRSVFAARALQPGEVLWKLPGDILISERMLPASVRDQIRAIEDVSESAKELAFPAAVLLAHMCGLKLHAPAGLLEDYIAAVQAVPAPRNVFFFSDRELDLLQASGKFAPERSMAQEATRILRSLHWGASSLAPCSLGGEALEASVRSTLAHTYSRGFGVTTNERRMSVLAPWVDFVNHYADGGTRFAKNLLHAKLPSYGSVLGPAVLQANPGLQDALNPLSLRVGKNGMSSQIELVALRAVQAGEELHWDYMSGPLQEGGLGSLLQHGFRTQPASLASLDISTLHRKVPEEVFEAAALAGCGDRPVQFTIWDVPQWKGGLYPGTWRCLEALYIAVHSVKQSLEFLEDERRGDAMARVQMYTLIGKTCKEEQQILERLADDANLAVSAFAADLARGPLQRCFEESRSLAWELVKQKGGKSTEKLAAKRTAEL